MDGGQDDGLMDPKAHLKDYSEDYHEGQYNPLLAYATVSNTTLTLEQAFLASNVFLNEAGIAEVKSAII